MTIKLWKLMVGFGAGLAGLVIVAVMALSSIAEHVDEEVEKNQARELRAAEYMNSSDERFKDVSCSFSNVGRCEVTRMDDSIVLLACAPEGCEPL